MAGTGRITTRASFNQIGVYTKLISLPGTLSCVGSSKADVTSQVRVQTCSLEKIAKAKMAAACDVAVDTSKKDTSQLNNFYISHN
jgi:hypothetical protein